MDQGALRSICFFHLGGANHHDLSGDQKMPEEGVEAGRLTKAIGHHLLDDEECEVTTGLCIISRLRVGTEEDDLRRSRDRLDQGLPGSLDDVLIVSRLIVAPDVVARSWSLDCRPEGGWQQRGRHHHAAARSKSLGVRHPHGFNDKLTS